jgi:nitrate reductase NapA
MNITRRQLLKYSAAVAAASAIGLELSLPQELIAAEADVEKWVKGVCRYCGAGCGVYVGVKAGKVVAVKGDKDNWNKGFLCLKGNFLPAIMSTPDRATHPLLRKGSKFVRISWKEAMDLMVGKFAEAYKADPQSVAFYGSGQAYTEESYFMNKLFKGGLGTNNIDCNPRLFMASAADGYVSTFGKDEPMGAYDDMYHADCFFIIGSNRLRRIPLFSRS